LKKPHRVFLFSRLSSDHRPFYPVFSFLFLLGIGIGYLTAGQVTGSQRQELSEYLYTYMRSAASAQSAPVLRVLFAYFRGPVALLLAGFFAGAVWLVPLLILGQGMLLSFSVFCFAAALGRSGLLCAFVAFGIRCLFVLPCSFFLAAQVWSASERIKLGDRTKRSLSPSPSIMFTIFICSLILLIGCVIEISLAPRLYAQILIHIPQ